VRTAALLSKASRYLALHSWRRYSGTTWAFAHLDPCVAAVAGRRFWSPSARRDARRVGFVPAGSRARARSAGSRRSARSRSLLARARAAARTLPGAAVSVDPGRTCSRGRERAPGRAVVPDVWCSDTSAACSRPRRSGGGHPRARAPFAWVALVRSPVRTQLGRTRGRSVAITLSPGRRSASSSSASATSTCTPCRSPARRLPLDRVRAVRARATCSCPYPDRGARAFWYIGLRPRRPSLVCSPRPRSGTPRSARLRARRRPALLAAGLATLLRRAARSPGVRCSRASSPTRRGRHDPLGRRATAPLGHC